MKKTVLIFILAVNITGLVFSFDIDEVRELLKPEREDEIDFSIIAALKEIEENQNKTEPKTAEHTVIITENEQQEKTSNSYIDNKKSKFIIFGCIFIIIAIIIFLVIRKRRNC